jgi:hypothetical protein
VSQPATIGRKIEVTSVGCRLFACRCCIRSGGLIIDFIGVSHLQGGEGAVLADMISRMGRLPFR